MTANLEKRGMRAIYILDYSDALYEESTNSKNPLTGKEQKGTASPQHSENVAAFAQWSAAAAVHFKDKNIIWEIWNDIVLLFKNEKWIYRICAWTMDSPNSVQLPDNIRKA